jgi:CubicO group peptidase (beta-lactamase class C family)
VELISKDHVGRLLPGDGYGLGFGVNTSVNDQNLELGSTEAYYWGGFFFTSFVIDPKEELIAIFMGQLHPTGGLTLDEKVLGLAFQAIID